MELLVGLGLLAIFVWVVRALWTGNGWNSAAMWQQQFDATEAWLGQCTNNCQHAEMICAAAPLGLDADESAVFVLPDVDLFEPRAVRYARSATGGPTIRLAKGLSFRFGSGVGQSESQYQLRTIDRGTLLLTTKRLAYLGSVRTSNVKLDDIIGLEHFTDGIAVHRKRKDRTETYKLSRSLQIPDGAGKGLTVFGPMITTAIQLAKIFSQNPAELTASRQQAGSLQSPYREQRPGLSPLQYGSLYRSDCAPLAVAAMDGADNAR